MACAAIEGTFSLVRVGQVPEALAGRLTRFLAGRLDLPCTLNATAIDPEPAFDRFRGQYDCRILLAELEEIARREGGHVLGIADVDLFSAVFTFVFGEAKLRGRAGLFSLHRLRPGFYGLADDPVLLEARARREALHETGHLFGLAHCRQPECVMRFSGAAEEVDLKSDAFCSACERFVRDRPHGLGA